MYTAHNVLHYLYVVLHPGRAELELIHWRKHSSLQLLVQDLAATGLWHLKPADTLNSGD